MNIMVTGHRDIIPLGYRGNPFQMNNILLNHHAMAKEKIKQICTSIKEVYYNNNEFKFITGMALGADQLFAESIIDIKKNTNCKLVAAIPFKGQESNWPTIAQSRYFNILNNCDEIHYICDPGYAPWKMMKRNTWMLENSDLTLAIYDGRNIGGTYNVIKQIKTQKYNRKIIVLNSLTLEIR